jgi:RNA-binding protein
MPLTPRQKRRLRGLTHALHPLVIVGERGLSESVMAEIEAALRRHELIKVRLRADRETRSDWAQQIARTTGAEQVHAIGQVACFFRRNPDRPVIDPDA